MFEEQYLANQLSNSSPVANSLKKPWTTEEDEKLRELVGKYGIGNWVNSAELLPGRTGKQCRERWHNHLDPAIKKGDWTEDEDQLIVSMQRSIGNQWAKMSKLLPGRSDNAIKNRYHALLRAKTRDNGSSFDDFDNNACTNSNTNSYPAPEIPGMSVSTSGSWMITPAMGSNPAGGAMDFFGYQPASVPVPPQMVFTQEMLEQQQRQLMQQQQLLKIQQQQQILQQQILDLQSMNRSYLGTSRPGDASAPGVYSAAFATQFLGNNMGALGSMQQFGIGMPVVPLSSGMAIEDDGVTDSGFTRNSSSSNSSNSSNMDGGASLRSSLSAMRSSIASTASRKSFGASGDEDAGLGMGLGLGLGLGEATKRPALYGQYLLTGAVLSNHSSPTASTSSGSPYSNNYQRGEDPSMMAIGQQAAVPYIQTQFPYSGATGALHSQVPGMPFSPLLQQHKHLQQHQHQHQVMGGSAQFQNMPASGSHFMIALSQPQRDASDDQRGEVWCLNNEDHSHHDDAAFNNAAAVIANHSSSSKIAQRRNAAQPRALVISTQETPAEPDLAMAKRRDAVSAVPESAPWAPKQFVPFYQDMAQLQSMTSGSLVSPSASTSSGSPYSNNYQRGEDPSMMAIGQQAAVPYIQTRFPYSGATGTLPSQVPGMPFSPLLQQSQQQQQPASSQPMPLIGATPAPPPHHQSSGQPGLGYLGADSGDMAYEDPYHDMDVASDDWDLDLGSSSGSSGSSTPKDRLSVHQTIGDGAPGLASGAGSDACGVSGAQKNARRRGASLSLTIVDDHA